MDSKYNKKGHDIWKRARTNAFAHKLRYEQMHRNQNYFFCFEMVAVILPIIFSGIISQVSTDASLVKNLAIYSIISSGIALFLSILASSFNFQEKKMSHKKLVSDYSLLAQRARRLFNESYMEPDEERLFIRFLEETFEVLKASGEEPSNKYFIKANNLLEQINVQPSLGND